MLMDNLWLEVTIMVKGTTRAVLSDANGFFLQFNLMQTIKYWPFHLLE